MRKKRSRNTKFKLFLAGYCQVMMVAMNVGMIAHSRYFGALITSFLLSSIWAYNVKNVAFGNAADGLTYAGGAACGTLTGMLLTNLFY